MLPAAAAVRGQRAGFAPSPPPQPQPPPQPGGASPSPSPPGSEELFTRSRPGKAPDGGLRGSRARRSAPARLVLVQAAWGNPGASAGLFFFPSYPTLTTVFNLNEEAKIAGGRFEDTILLTHLESMGVCANAPVSRVTGINFTSVKQNRSPHTQYQLPGSISHPCKPQQAEKSAAQADNTSSTTPHSRVPCPWPMG